MCAKVIPWHRKWLLLPNNLTIERIQAGISNIRNPILVSFVAKGLMPYHGLGSGIKRALDAWPHIDFTDDREGCLFTVTVHRKETESSVETGVKPTIAGETSGKTSGKILEAMRQNKEITIPELAVSVGVTERSIEWNIQILQRKGFLLRIGPAKGGHWEVVE
jgi:ATP-dependent DNA helicase RecG